jgi:hypothetical protein
VIGDNGEAVVNQEVKSTGNFRSLFKEIIKQPEEKQRESLNDYLDYRPFDNYKLLSERDSLPWHNSAIELGYKKYFDFKAGNKLFIQQHVYKMLSEEIREDDKRTIEYIFEEPYFKQDIIRIVAPKSYVWENVPETQTNDTNLFTYTRDVRKISEDNILELTTTLVLKRIILSPEEYKQAVIFFKQVASEESKKIVLVKP